MKTLIEKPRPGAFKAYCNLVREVPWDKMTEDLWAIANARGYARQFRELASGRVDPETRRKGRWVVAFAGCQGFETTDPAAFERHMADVHNRKPAGPRQLKQGTGHWRAPKLADDGQPFKLSTKAVGEYIETCAACGLIAEVTSTHADELWWREHVERCTGVDSAVA
jgi:hypothetical protein